jgi:hypothetical protein
LQGLFLQADFAAVPPELAGFNMQRPSIERDFSRFRHISVDSVRCGGNT